MKPEEAIEELKFSNEKCLEQCEGACSSRKNNDCACQDAVIERMLDELLQYREIGTVEQVRNQKHNLEMAYKIISDYEAIGTVEECREAKRFKEYFDELYGIGLEVANWHQNGDTEPFDNFYDAAIDWSEQNER